MWFTLLLILGAVIAYANEKIPMEITSIVILSLLLLFFYFFPLMDAEHRQILTTEKLLMGFANPALITVMALLVLGQAIVQTGALNEVPNIILKISRNNAFFAIGLTLLFVMGTSAFLNNTPVVVIFIPIIAALARAVNISASKVMIPLSFASILGGMTTLIGSSTNLLVSGIMTEMGQEPLGFFDFSYPGIFMAMVGFVYVLVVTPRMLPDRASLVREFTGDDDERQFIAQIEIDYSSDFVGQQLEDGCIAGYSEVSVRMIQRGEHAFLPPFGDDMLIRPRDVVVIAAPKKELKAFFAKNKDSLDKAFSWLEKSAEDEGEDLVAELSMAEIVVAPGSKIVGRNLEQIGFYRQYNCVVLGIQRQSKVIRSKLSEIRLAPGDVLLIMGRHRDIMAMHESKDFLLMEWSTEDFHPGRKALPTMLIFSAAVGVAALDMIPIAISAIVGVALILISQCINLRQAGRALDVKIVLMIAASLAMGSALQATGGASFLANMFIAIMSGAPPLAVMSALFFFMAVMTNVLSNNATAVLFTPIALNLATQLGVDPRMFIFAVIFACNCSFITPIGYQTNLMVMGPGHHKFADFIRSGIPLAIIIWAAYFIFCKLVFV